MNQPLAKVKYSEEYNNYVLDDILNKDSVSTDKIVDQNITEEKIKDKNITNIKIDDKSIDNRTLGDQSVSNSKVLDDTLTFDKMTDETRYINTNSAICALKDVGGIKVGDKIDSVDIRTLLKSIITPPTAPAVNVKSTITTSDVLYGLNNTCVINGTTDKSINTSTIYVPVGTVLTIKNIVSQVMMKSDTISSIKVKIDINNSLYSELNIVFNNNLFEPNKYYDFSNDLDSVNISMDALDKKVRITLTVVSNDNLTSTDYIDFISRAPVIWFNADVFDFIDKGLKLYLQKNNHSIDDCSKYYTNTSNISLTFRPKVNLNSIVCIPMYDDIEGNISKLIDQNNFTQAVQYIGVDHLNFNGNTIAYSSYLTDKCTASEQTYKFIISQRRRSDV